MTMPSDIRIAATTMSMTRKGMNTTKPMMKAPRSSLITNAGTRVRSDTSSRLSGRD